jgi:uncharacterized membrane protein
LFLGLLVLLYVFLVGALAVQRHRGFGSRAFDLGIYDQALWLISAGYPPVVTIRGLHILGDHFTPILYPLALLYRLGGGTETLLWVQTIALALGAVPLHRMGTRLSRSPGVGLVAGGLYLLYPPLRGVNLFDFHPIALAVPGLLFALDFAFQRRAIPFLLACGWVALCKQEAALVAGCLGLWYAIRWRQPRALLLCVAGALWFLVAIRLQARFAGSSDSPYVELYSRFGNSTGEIASTFLLTPWIPLQSLVSLQTASYLVTLLAPLALLPLRGPGVLWLLAVPLGLNMLSMRGAMRDPELHSVALLVPIAFAAATAALSTVAKGSKRRLVAGSWIVCAGIAAVSHVPAQQTVALKPPLSAAEAAGAERVLKAIPEEASVSATQSIVPHLAHRRSIYLFPNPFWPLAAGPTRRAIRQERGRDHPRWDRARFDQALQACDLEYIVIGTSDALSASPFPALPWDYLRMVEETLRHPDYRLVAAESGISILRRVRARARGPLRRVNRATAPPSAPAPAAPTP